MKTVLLTVDALRADHLAQYGYERETMPVVDRLLDEGVQFETAIANGTNTGVSLPSLLSSQYFGVDSVRDGPNVASTLSESGVTTAGFHSNALFSNRVKTVHGFDHYEDFGVSGDADEDDEETAKERVYNRLVETLRPIVEQLGVRGYAESVQEFIFPASMIHEFSVYTDAATLTDEVLDWARDNADNDYFLWVHYMDLHRPYGIDVEDPAFGEYADEEEIQTLMAKAGVNPESITPEERERLIDLYDSDLRYTSKHISRLIDGFEELGVWAETGLVFTADHGEEFGEHGYYYHRNRPYDELVHVPLVVRYPARNEEAVISSQRELLDIAPTVCEWHDITPPEEFLGKPLFSGEDRQAITTGSFIEQSHVVAGRWDGWKYISVESEDTELFNINVDPNELQDVSAEYEGVVQEFEKTIPDSVFSGEPVTVHTSDEDMQQRLADLGYLE